MKITPILIVDAIEPSLKFWADQLGFEKIAEVPDGDKLGFVILQKDGCEVMMQTRDSIRRDAGPTAETMLEQGASLYIEVDDFADARNRAQGAEVLVPERVAFYGMREIFVRDPGRHVIGFAAKAQDSSQP
jgi:uncharacterized glyoxalase superfamily protein PhnB